MTTAIRKIATGVALASAAALLLAGCAPADNNGGNEGGDVQKVTLQFNSYLGNSTPQAKSLIWYFEEVEKASNGTIKIDQFWDGSLLDGPSSLAGVSDGRVDMVHVPTIYNPSELPLTQITAMPFITGDVAASGLTFQELYETNDAFRAEWDKHNVHSLFFIGVAPSFVSAPEKVTNFDWLKGKTLRASGYIAEALQKAGGNAVGLPVVDVYEAIQRGTIDGYTNMILDTVPVLSLQEVSPWIAETGLGLYTVNSLSFNKTKWDSLSEEHRKIFTDVASKWQDYYLKQLTEVEDTACQLLIDNGGGSTVWSDAEIKKWSDALGSSALDKWRADAQASGADVEAFYQTYIDTLRGHEGSYVNGITRCAELTK
ncbi:MAG: C4-dicarboxylate TRAP transporter substrate-binding protein [Microbacteriaceae bacterium]